VDGRCQDALRMPGLGGEGTCVICLTHLHPGEVHTGLVDRRRVQLQASDV
jgi:hypothetical protein